MARTKHDIYAAIDLGSNSFHMIVAAYKNDQFQIIDRIRESVRFADGLDDEGNLNEEAIERALKCLERFGQRIREIPHSNIRAVGTNSLRQARNKKDFMGTARQLLGHPIEIIAGREEARLIFQGVAHTVHNKTDKRLVVDIGGGSTEVIIGKNFEPINMESLDMGCVNVSQKYFKSGAITSKQMRKAILYAHQEMESIQSAYLKQGWNTVIGCSGTILAINSIVQANDWGEAEITASSLEKLKESMINTGSIEALDFGGLSEDRKEVIAGGLAVLSAVFEALNIKKMSVSDGALREGLLYDLIGRAQEKNVRDFTIDSIADRYSVDKNQSQRVEDVAVDLFKQAKKFWPLKNKPDLKLLRWAAKIHEIGLSIAHTQYHKHGAYLLAYSDMPGFSTQEQLHLSLLVRSHRRKFPVSEFDAILEEDRDKITMLCLLFRIAIVLNRSRPLTSLPVPILKIKEEKMVLDFPDDWLNEHPLTQVDLETEANYFNRTKYQLNYS